MKDFIKMYGNALAFIIALLFVIITCSIFTIFDIDHKLIMIIIGILGLPTFNYFIIEFHEYGHS